MLAPPNHVHDASPATPRHRPRNAGEPGPVAISWSGGKDSALVLDALRADPTVRLEWLVSTIVDETECLTMHGVPKGLVDAQAAAIGLPVAYVRVPAMPRNDVYERAMSAELRRLCGRGVHHVAFGDLFLEDIRAYRDRLLAAHDMTALYPLWGRDTRQLATEFVERGFRALVVCADPERLDASYCGREYDPDFLRDLPVGVDPCGENGEFHSCVHAAPGWAAPVGFTRGAVARREGFWYCTLGQ